MFYLTLITAYLLGSLSSAIIVCKAFGLPDPRSQGSKNPGATNVMRIGGKKLAVLVLVGDVLKGVVAVLLAKTLGLSGELLAAAGFAVFLGHCFPVFFSFKGGKGVATAMGALLALSPFIAGLTFLVWLIVFAVFRYSSLAAMTAAKSLCTLIMGA